MPAGTQLRDVPNAGEHFTGWLLPSRSPLETQEGNQDSSLPWLYGVASEWHNTSCPKGALTCGQAPPPKLPHTDYSSLLTFHSRHKNLNIYFSILKYYKVAPKPLPHPELFGSLSRALSNVTTTKDSLMSRISAPQSIKKTSPMIYSTGLGWFPLHPISKWNVLSSVNKSSL